MEAMGSRPLPFPTCVGAFRFIRGRGLTGASYVIGEMAGSETVTLATQQTPAHSHPVACGVGSGTQVSPQNGFFAATPGGNSAGFRDTSNAQMQSSTVSPPAGGVTPHENMMPYLTLTFIICLYGIFPTPQ